MKNANLMHFLKQKQKTRIKKKRKLEDLETFFPSQSKEEEEVVSVMG